MSEFHTYLEDTPHNCDPGNIFCKNEKCGYQPYEIRHGLDSGTIDWQCEHCDTYNLIEDPAPDACDEREEDKAVNPIDPDYQYEDLQFAKHFPDT